MTRLALLLALALLALAWWLRRAEPVERDENLELLRRLDQWREGDRAGPLIRWSAAHLRGELNVPVETDPYLEPWFA